MTIILDNYPIPESGVLEIKHKVEIGVSAESAHKIANQWVFGSVSYMMCAQSPTLVIDKNSVWRIPVLYTAPQAGHVGVVGHVDVDVLTGELLNPEKSKTMIIECAEKIAANLPSYQRGRQVSAQFMPQHIPQAPIIRVEDLN